MSYAGPVSRGKRAQAAPAKQAGKSAAAGRGGAARPLPPGNRALPAVDDHRPTLVFAAGIVVGLLVGAGTALLLAPQAGADTRRSIARSSRRAARNAALRGHDAWDDLRDEFRRAMRNRRRARLRGEPAGDPTLVVDVD